MPVCRIKGGFVIIAKKHVAPCDGQFPYFMSMSLTRGQTFSSDAVLSDTRPSAILSLYLSPVI